MPKVSIGGVQLYYEWHGPEGAPVLVLNNGIIMNAASSWVFQTQALSQQYRLLQYDCRGQGLSDHPEGPYSMQLHADDLAALLDALEVERAHIAGISYGGEVSQAFALRYPAQTGSLILADTVSEVGPKLRMIAESWMDALKTEDPGIFFRATVPWNFSARFIQENPQLFADALQRYASLDFPAVYRLCECFLGIDFTKRLGDIEAPTCILVGEFDILKGLPYARILNQNIRDSELHILPEAGHASCWENAGAFNAAILHFLQKRFS
jgi:3-oxoadipate enol-lactonase